MGSVLGLQVTQIDAPPAPIIKDLDSFTEGTAIGSFDSIPAGPTNELGDSIAPINAMSLALLPPQENQYHSIELWRAVVYSCDLPDPDSYDPAQKTIKRPRSNAQDDDDERRRARVRIDIASPTPLHPCWHSANNQLYHVSFRRHSAPPG